MKLLAQIFYAIEVGAARSMMRIIPLTIVVLGIVALYNMRIYKGLNDMASMDNAQLARQIQRHQGFNTYFIRPYALTQVGTFWAKHGQTEMFPDSIYPPATPRIIPDTYNAPGYPLELALLFKLSGIDLDEPNSATAARHAFIGDKVIPPFNQLFILLTAGLLFLMGWRFFDERVAWMGSIAFVVSDFVWNYSMQAAPINFLMLLTTILFYGATELYQMAETKFDNNDLSNGWAWLIVPGLAVVLGLIALNSLLLTILVLPFVVFLMLMWRTNWAFPFIVVGIVGLMVAPWFYHWYRACGNPLGSNLTFGLLGQTGYEGNQIYCSTTIPTYSGLLSGFGAKQYAGFLYYFRHGWSMLGAHPMVLLFAAAILHEFRRRRVRALYWLLVSSAFAIIFMTNLGNAQPETQSDWNLVAVLLPTMVLIGTAFFFTLLDRMTTQLPLLTMSIVVGALLLTFAPMLLVFTTNSYAYYNYPPYLPPYLSYLSRLAPPDKWVTTDIPWATAWYGDRASLWMPDSVADFTSINDNVSESALILITPATLSKPMLNLTSGEQKDWMPYVVGANIPDSFPLHHFVKLPAGGPEYSIISNALGGAPK